MAPVRSSSRRRRWQGETLSLIRAANSVTVRRPSSSSSARIWRSMRSMSKILPRKRPSTGRFATICPSRTRRLATPMKPSLVVTFATIDVLLVLTPGPDWAYVVAVGLREQMVLPAVAGLVAGYATLTGLVAAGLAVLITTSPGALTAVTLLGGAYLIWLGASVLSRPGEDETFSPS